MVLAACASNPDDGQQYFDNITPDPLALDAERQRLAAAESGEAVPTTVLPPVDGEIAETDPALGNPEISDTQNFAKLKERETIASDAAKLAKLKEGYVVVEPTAVPTRNTRVNLAAFALESKNPIGQRVYKRRGGLSGCSKYRKDPDAAQRAFLSSGGPSSDKLNLDRDGDGFACAWDPSIYRRLLPQG